MMCLKAMCDHKETRYASFQFYLPVAINKAFHTHPCPSLCPERGCSAATVRVWKDPAVWQDPEDAVIEMCGDALPPEQIQIKSKGSLFRMSFHAAAKAVGAKGFKAAWTQIQESELV